MTVETLRASPEAAFEGSPAATGEPPAWLRWAALVPAAAVLAFGWVGLLLAVNGWYRPALAFPLGVLACAGVVLLSRRALRSAGPAHRDAHVVAALGLAAILAITAWNGAHASQHVLINRDGGSYLNTGRWIARDGSLEVRPRVGPFATEKTIGFTSFAVYDMPDGTLQFQFSHLLPVVLAEGYAIAGDRGLTHMPELLGGVALLAFFVLAWRLFRRPWFALAAMLALAFVIPQVSFSRDSYSEIPSQVLLFTALWLLASPHVLPRWRVAFVAGLFLGATQSMRIDALVFMIGVPVLLAVAWLRSSPEERRVRTLPSIVAFVAGLVPGVTLGFVDLVNHSGRYWSDLWHNVRKLAAVTVASAIACGALVLVWKYVFPWLRRLPWRTIATVAAWIVGVTGLAAWQLRPRIQHVHAAASGLVLGLQQHEHRVVDATRAYYEQSLTWMSWYLGPVAVAAAIVGAALLVRAVLLGRFTRATAALATLVPGSVLYLWKADAAPDQVWVMRRFLVSAFPTLVLLALGVAAYAWSTQARDARALVRRGAALVIVVFAIGWPLVSLVGVRDMSEQRGYLTVVKDACGLMGPRPVVVVVDKGAGDNFDGWVPQALRGWCGADVAITTKTASTQQSLTALAQAWSAQGRKLYLVAPNGDLIRGLVAGTTPVATPTVVNHDFLQRTLTHRPERLVPEAFNIVVAPVPAR